MIKFLLILLLFSVGVIAIFYLTIKQMKNSYEDLEIEKGIIQSNFDDLNSLYKNMKKEMEIEKENNKKLLEKLSAVACMSIDDILSELQK